MAREDGIPIWIIGHYGRAILGYDEVEDSYATGTVSTADLLEGAIVADWSMYDELRWAVAAFVEQGPTK
jgi:hypothetical protein